MSLPPCRGLVGLFAMAAESGGRRIQEEEEAMVAD